MSKLSRENQRVLEKQLKDVEEYPAGEIRYVLETYGAGLSTVQVDRLACLAGCLWYYGKVAGRAEAMEVKDILQSCATESFVPEVTTDTGTIINFDATRQK